MPLGRQAKVKAMKIYTVSNNKKEEGVQANASTNKRKPIRNTFISLLFVPQKKTNRFPFKRWLIDVIS